MIANSHNQSGSRVKAALPTICNNRLGNRLNIPKAAFSERLWEIQKRRVQHEKMTKTALAILLSLCLCIGMIPAGIISVGAAADDSQSVGFSPDNFKAQIKKVSIGAPITGTDGKKYLPVDVHFFAVEYLSDSEVVHFLEGYMKAQLKGGGLAESIKGLGMTLMGSLKTDAPLESNMWNWDWTPYDTGGGQGVIKYNVPLLEEGETQTVEQSQATGLTEANGVVVGDQVTIQNETVVNTNGFPENIVQELFPDGPSVFSDPFTFTVEELSNYPKEITVSQVDDKTVAPPAEVVLPYTGQPQACPYTDTDGYYVTLNDPETDAGIYTAVLLLREGYKWTDGSTNGKPAIWAIDKAHITSVTLQNAELTYNSQEQHPVISSVTAGTLTVPAEGYTVSYSETPLYAGKYTLTVKGKGNFTGSASAEFEIFTVTADTCNHVDYSWRYEDNNDGKTHKVFCWNCGGCLNNSESHQIVYDAIHNQDGEPIGVYNPRCIHCGYEGDSVFCNHTDELEYTDNGLGTHKVTCKRCKKVVAEKESHKIVTTPITTNVGGVEAYLGQFTYSCEKCDYRAEFTCDHKNTGRIEYTPQNTSYPDYTHIARCAKCLMLLVDDQEACTSDGSWEPSSLTTHISHCSICGQVMTGYHDFKGTRKITKFEATPYKGGLFNLFTRYNYRVYYTETCKVCKGVRNGYFDNPMPSTENWADFRAALQSIVDMSPEQLQSFADNDILGYGKHYLMIPANMLSLIYEATGTNEMNYANLDSEFLLNFTNTSDEGSCKMFDKDGKEIASHKPDNNKSVTPTGADRITASVGNGDEDEGALESELETWSFTDEDGAALGVSTDLLMSLEDGEHTLTACFSNENGDRAAVTMLFTIYTTDDGQKAIKDLHPQGTMINADGDVVSMNISKNTLIYTGESLELPSVTMTSEMGVEYAEDEDYTLTYYQVVEDENGEFTEVEIDREQITEIGTYNVVANPTRNGVLSGSAWAQFVVNTPLFGDTNQDGIATISDVTAIQRVLAELESFSDLQMLLADANQDGEVNITDATTIQRYLAEFDIPYPIGKPIG